MASHYLNDIRYRHNDDSIFLYAFDLIAAGYWTAPYVCDAAGGAFEEEVVTSEELVTSAETPPRGFPAETGLSFLSCLLAAWAPTGLSSAWTGLGVNVEGESNGDFSECTATVSGW
jgi:hypothetical protein